MMGRSPSLAAYPSSMRTACWLALSGVSGSSVENDHAVAEAGVKVLGVSELPEHPWRT